MQHQWRLSELNFERFFGCFKFCGSIKYFKCCVHYIFASSASMSNKEHFWNKGKWFLFLFESSFCSWDNQILNFQIFKCHHVIKCLSMKPGGTPSLNNLGGKHSLVIKFGQFMLTYKIEFFIKKLYENCSLEISSRPLANFKESFVKLNLRRTHFDSFVITYLI